MPALTFFPSRWARPGLSGHERVFFSIVRNLISPFSIFFFFGRGFIAISDWHVDRRYNFANIIIIAFLTDSRSSARANKSRGEGRVTDPASSLARQVHPSGPAATAGWVIGGAGMKHARCTRWWRFLGYRVIWPSGPSRAIGVTYADCTGQLDSGSCNQPNVGTGGSESKSIILPPLLPNPAILPPTTTISVTTSSLAACENNHGTLACSCMYISPQFTSFFEFQVFKACIVLAKTNSISFGLSLGSRKNLNKPTIQTRYQKRSPFRFSGIYP